jgi:hypothetical protein
MDATVTSSSIQVKPTEPADSISNEIVAEGNKWASSWVYGDFYPA